MPDEQLGYASGRGAPELRHALAEYLNRVRGTSARPDDVVICNGYAQGIALVIDVLVRAGARRLAVEDPCADDDAVPRRRAAGLEVVGVPSAPTGSASMRSTGSTPTPWCSRPRTSGRPAGSCRPGPARRCCAGRERRARWSSRTTTTRSTATTERRSAPCRGWRPTASSTPARRARRSRRGFGSAGWWRRPIWSSAIAAAKKLADRGSPVLDQLAFADFLARGEFDRHLRRMRPLYRRRRDALLAALR